MMGYGWDLQLAGLVLGFVGGLFLTIAQQAVGGGAAGFVRTPGARVRAFVVLRFPRMWKAGLVLMWAAFILQLAGHVVARPQ